MSAKATPAKLSDIVVFASGRGTNFRAICEAAGIKDILTKSFRSNNPSVLVIATFDALKKLRTREDIELLRGVSLL